MEGADRVEGVWGWNSLGMVGLVRRDDGLVTRIGRVEIL